MAHKPIVSPKEYRCKGKEYPKEIEKLKDNPDPRPILPKLLKLNKKVSFNMDTELYNMINEGIAIKQKGEYEVCTFNTFMRSAARSYVYLLRAKDRGESFKDKEDTQ